jgi:PKD repeat protein/subtilisin family serine protease
MTFRAILALFSTCALALPLGGQETLSPATAGIIPATQIVSNVPALSGQPSAETKSTSALAATLNLTDQKLTDATTIINGLTNGVISVIVNLVPPPAALDKTDFSSKTFLSTLQSQIKQLQQNVLDTLSTKDVRVGFRFDNIPGFSAEVTADGLKALQANPQVALIEPVYLIEPHLAQGIPLIHGMTYRTTYNGAGLAIAICDTGIDYNHAQLGGGGFPNSKVLGGYDFGDNDADPIPDTQAHGTCCAGIAAGNLGTVGDYIGGVAYNAKLYALKISSGTSGSATTAAMVSAWDWCVTHKNDNPSYPIMVISTSFGGGQYFSTCDSATPSMTTAANNANAAGITVLASSGNDGFCDSLAWPACISSVISVGAVYDAPFGTYLPCISSLSCAPTKTATGGCSTGYYATDSTAADKVTSYANVASFLTVLAPGNQCYTLDISGSSGYSSGDYYDSFGGTSAACPYAAGAVACLQSAAKAITGNFLTPQEVRNRLINYGDNVTDTKVAITKPRVNLERAIQSISTGPLLNFASATLSGGNGNQSVDPNECNHLTLVIRNDGYSTASNITATLTTATPGVTVVQPGSSYPDTDAKATATNTTAFKINTSPAFVCGTPVNLTLVLNYNGGANTNLFSLSSGSSNYVVTVGSGAIIPGTTDIGNHGDDTVTSISLPFGFTFYSQTFSNATLSSNGNLQFLSSSTAFNNSCLPNGNFNYAILPLWDDLRTDGSGGGIFTSISGSAPNRIFNIEWRSTYYSGGAAANFEVRLYESQPRVELIYGNLNGTGSTATVGIQKDTGSVTAQFGCNAGVLAPGLQLTFQPNCTDGGGQCAMTLAGFTASPTNGTWPLTVNFTNLSIGATNFIWDFGDDHTSTNWNTSNVYSNAGNYTVSLAAVGAGVTNSLIRPNFIVVNNPPPVANFAANTTNGIGPLTVNFTNLSSDATNFAWDFGDGNTSTDSNPTNIYSIVGTYTVSLTAVGAGGTNQFVRANYIVVNEPPPPVVDFASDKTNGILPLAVVFTNLSTGATNSAWDFGDGNTSAGSNPTNIYSIAGTYTVTLTAIGAGGTSQLIRANYILVNDPPPVADFVADITNGTFPLMVNFTNGSSEASSYSWDFGDGNLSADLNPQNTFTNAGTFTVTLTAIGPGGTNQLFRTNYIVVNSPPLPVSDFAAGPTNGIAPLTVYFTNLSVGANTYSWNFNDGDTSASVNPAETFTNAGIYTVTLTAIGPGGTNSLVLTNFIIAINPPLLAVNPASLDFGLIVTGATSQATLVVSNAGEATLDGTATMDGEPFTIADLWNGPVLNSVFSLAGLSSTNLVLRFAPTMEGAFTNAIVFVSNGGDSTNAITGRSVGTVLLGQIELNGTDFMFSFATVPGINYFVEYKDALTDPNWQPLQSVPGDGTVANFTNAISATLQRFFRVSAQ